MTREDVIKRIRRILEECKEYNEDDEVAMCYVTPYDADALDMAIKALEQEPCEDAVSRSMAIDKLKEHYFDKKLQSAKDDPCIIDAMTDLDIRIVKELPPVSPTQKTGQWVLIDKEHAYCSECGYGNVDLFNGRPHNYCPNCGAKMDEEEDE